MPKKKYKKQSKSVAGIPKKSAGRRSSTEQEMYELGRTAAGIKQQKEQLGQEIAMNVAQMAMIADAKRQLQDILAAVERRMATTPPPQANVPLSPLPSAGAIPGGPMGSPGPALAEAGMGGGMPPEAMPPQGAGPMQGGPEPAPMEF